LVKLREQLDHLKTKEQSNKDINEEIYVCQVDFANWIFQMAYRSSDTVEHGAYMVELSVDNYLPAIRTLLLLMSQHNCVNLDDGMDRFCSSHLSWELLKRMDHLRLLLVTLGHSAEYLQTLEAPPPPPAAVGATHQHDNTPPSMLEASIQPTMEMDLVRWHSSLLFSTKTPAAQLSILLFKLHCIARLKNYSFPSSPPDESTPPSKDAAGVFVHGDGNNNKNNNNNNNLEWMISQQTFLVQQQLQDTVFDFVWKAFFQRGTYCNEYQDGKITYCGWGPATLDWEEKVQRDNDKDDSSSSSPASLSSLPLPSPPRDFYLWLQDSCFFDPNISQLVEEIVEPNHVEFIQVKP
jgi:hypothetical protein